MQIKLKKLREDARIPKRGSKFAAGSDLFACLDNDYLSIAPHQTMTVHTGLAVEIPMGYFGAVFARSGIASKRGLRPANCVGVIDSDYRGEVLIALHNDMDTHQFVENGERVAQLVILPCQSVEFTEVKELSETEREDGGFGSSGEKEFSRKNRKENAYEDEFRYEW